MVGGIGALEEPTPEVQAIIDELKGEIEAKIGKSVEKLTLLSFKTQIVAGRNYFAKVKAGDNEHIHVRIYHDLSNAKTLSTVQTGKTHEEEIVYF
uniref:Cystatin-A2 n=1 Tax=Caligus rogercresseyi TaxID=217165 RepID=C1BP18_CALRO|nr:Cystatin-A2 [Caligus rogercresseyi]